MSAKPTAGAIRAARAFLSQPMFFHDEVPSIIDREAGLLDILELLEELRDLGDFFGDVAIPTKVLDRIKAAIIKLRGE